MRLLPPDLTVLGIDEKTALILDIYNGHGKVIGLGGVTLIHTGHQHAGRLPSDLEGTGLVEVAQSRNGHVHQYRNGEVFALSECCPFELPNPQAGVSEAVWQAALATQQLQDEPPPQAPLPAEVLALVEARQAARTRRDWAAADALRQRIGALGWQVVDTPAGPQLISRIKFKSRRYDVADDDGWLHWPGVDGQIHGAQYLARRFSAGRAQSQPGGSR